MRDKLAVVVLNWNGLEFLRQFLGKIIDYSLNPGISVYLADNGSTDGSASWVADSFPEVSIIRLDRNYGFAEGYNLALEQITAEYYLLLNSDIEVTPGWTEPLISYLDENPEVAACQPKILSFIDRDHFEYAGAAGGYIDKYGYPFCRGRIMNITEPDNSQYDNIEDVFWTSGACMAVRAEAWKKCGGFDADFFAHMEEIDLCWRLNSSGYRLTYIPGSKVYHIGGGSLPYSSPFKTLLNFRNSLYLLYKNLPPERLHRIMFIRKLMDGLAALIFLFTGKIRHFMSVWKAHMEYYRNIESLKKKRKLVMDRCNKKVPDHILNKSIIFEFYIKGNKTFGPIKPYF